MRRDLSVGHGSMGKRVLYRCSDFANFSPLRWYRSSATVDRSRATITYKECRKRTSQQYFRKVNTHPFDVPFPRNSLDHFSRDRDRHRVALAIPSNKQPTLVQRKCGVFDAQVRRARQVCKRTAHHGVHRRTSVRRGHGLVHPFERKVCRGTRWPETKAVPRCGGCTAATFRRARCCGLAIPALGAFRAFLRARCHVYACSDMRKVGKVPDCLD